MVLDKLVKTSSDEWQILSDFRSRCEPLGGVYSISYKRAIVALYDYHREKAGGVPKNSFLLAANKEDDGSFILLRVKDDIPLPNASQNDMDKLTGC